MDGGVSPVEQELAARALWAGWSDRGNSAGRYEYPRKADPQRSQEKTMTRENKIAIILIAALTAGLFVIDSPRCSDVQSIRIGSALLLAGC